LEPEAAQRYVAVTTIEQDGKVGWTATKRPSASARSSSRRQRLSPERRARAAQRRLRPPRPRRAGRAINTPRAGAADSNSARRWAATPSAPATTRPRPNCSIVRPPGHGGDGRGVRLLGARQEAGTITTCCSTTGTRRTGAPWSGATATIPASFSGASATRSRAGLAGGPSGRRRADPHRATRKIRRARPPPAAATAAGFNGFQKHRGRLRLQLQADASTAGFHEANPGPALRQRDRLLHQFARRVFLPRQQQQEPGQGRFPDEFLRPLRAALGDAARHRVQGAG
jgi:hypothetical protein